MINLDLRKTKIGEALKWSWLFELIKGFKSLFFLLTLASFGYFIYGFVLNKESEVLNRRVLGLILIFLSLYFGSLIKTLFYEIRVKNPKSKEELSKVLSEIDSSNLAEYLSFESAKAVSMAFGICRSPEISSTHLLFAVLSQNKKLDFILQRMLIDKNELLLQAEKELKGMPVLKAGERKLSESLEATLKKSIEIASIKNNKRVEVNDLFSALAKEDPFLKRYLLNQNLKADDIENLTWWLERIEERQKDRKRFWEADNLAENGTLAKAWTAGYTITLDKYAIDLTDSIAKKEIEFVGHKDELESVERILSVRGINNVLLVGQPGTGKKSIIYHLAKNSLTGQGMKDVNYKRVMELDLPRLLAQIESTEEIEVILDKIFQEVASAGNIILVIDNIHNYVGQVQAPGIIDISGILGPYLRLSEFRAVGITNYEGLHKNLERNSNILSLFQKVEVREISQRDTLCLMEFQTAILENQYGIYISYPALREIVTLTDRYFPALSFPEKALDLLKESAVYICGLRDGGKVLLPKHIDKIVSQKAEIPVGEIEAKEKDILLNLENLIHERIINQEEAVKEVSTALRRARSEITVRQGPMGAFLFLGPTGVGKTETSKALAAIYFGSEQKTIRMDMSEFQSSNDIPRLIGTTVESGLLTDQVRENPFSLVLLDEIEKAHPNILNLFLQVFDEGYLTDGQGRKIDFKNTIIISTSNAGAEMIIKAVKANEQWEGVRQRMTDYLYQERIFRPELLNRFDAIVLFTPLSKEHLLDIAGLLMKKLKKNLLEKGVEIIITDELKAKIVELGYNPVFGARFMRRVIQEKVENPLASALLDGRLARGGKVEVDAKDFSLIIK